MKQETLFTSQLSTNHNKFQQESDIKTKTDQSTILTKLYSSLCISTKTNDTNPVKTSLHLLNYPQLLHHHHHLFQHINLTTHYKPCLINQIKYLGNNIKCLKNHQEELKHLRERQHEE